MIEKIKRAFTQRDKSDRGASAVEYALIVGFIVAALITILATFGPRIADSLDKGCARVNGNVSCKSDPAIRPAP